MTLEQYFHLIVNTQPQKELTMFEKIKERLVSLWTKPVKFIEDKDPRTENEDYWSFEMVTNEWYSSDRDEVVPTVRSFVLSLNDSQWTDVLDKIITELEKHYGYNIKEQVYYSVRFPFNNEFFEEGIPNTCAGRLLNDTVLQQLLLSFPEVYDAYVPENYTLTEGVNV